MLSHRFQLTAYPEGKPTLDNFELVETELGDPGENEFLVRNEWLSVDPYMRGRMREGESTGDGLLLKSILPDGVVLEYAGQRFFSGR